MLSKIHRISSGTDQQAMRLIDTARWHTLRYDSLRASLSSRASFVVSADAVLIAGASFLFSWTAGRRIFGGILSVSIVGAGLILALIFALLSIRGASKAFLSNKSWRLIFSGDPPPSMFYQHSDTIRAAPSYAQFSAAFKRQTLDSELDWAITNLWLVLKMHAYRYGFLRAATRQLQVATLVFAGSAVAAVVLTLIR